MNIESVAALFDAENDMIDLVTEPEILKSLSKLKNNRAADSTRFVQ